MKNKKSRLWKRSMALVLSFLMLLPSVALAKNTDVVDDVPKTEVIQVDLNAEIEKALQEDDNLEDGLQITIGESEENASEIDDLGTDKAISPRGVDYPVTELYIVKVKGSYNGYEASELVNCGQGKHITDNASYETVNAYDKNTSLTITMQSIGFHLSYQNWTTTGDIYMTKGAPYDYVIGPKGGVKDYKMDFVLTPRDTQAEQTVFEFVYGAYQPNGINTYPGRYYRRLTVNWSNAISDEPAPVDLGYDRFQNALFGFDETMEVSFDEENWTAIPSDVYAISLYNFLDYQRGIVLAVRHKATDIKPPSAIAWYSIPGLTRPAPDVSLGYDSASGQIFFYNLTPGVMYDLSTNAFANGVYFEAPDSGVIGLSGEFLQPGNRLYLRLSSTDTEGPSAMTIFVIPEIDGSRVSMPSVADLRNIEDLDMIYLVNEGTVEDMENGIIAIAYDEENANSKTELIGSSEVVSTIAE